MARGNKRGRGGRRGKPVSGQLRPSKTAIAHRRIGPYERQRAAAMDQLINTMLQQPDFRAHFMDFAGPHPLDHDNDDTPEEESGSDSDDTEDSAPNPDQESLFDDMTDPATIILDIPLVNRKLTADPKMRKALTMPPWKKTLRDFVRLYGFRRGKALFCKEDLKQFCHCLLDELFAKCETPFVKQFYHKTSGKQARENWIRAHSETVLSILKELRQYISLQLRAVFDAYVAKHGRSPTKSDILRCIKRDLDMTKDEDYELFKFYVINVLPAATGNNLNWNEFRRNFETISTSKVDGKPGKYNVPPNTEAFLMWVFENNESKWSMMRGIKQQFPNLKINIVSNPMHAENMEEDGFATQEQNTVPPAPGYVNVWGRSYQTKYTTIAPHPNKYVDWTHEGKVRYQELKQICKEARETAAGKKVERDFLARLSEVFVAKQRILPLATHNSA